MNSDTGEFEIPPKFPSGFVGAFAVADPHEARALLARASEWRGQVASALERGLLPSVSPQLLELLGELLGLREPRSLARYPYRLEPYPEAGGDPVADLRDLLLWRAGIADFLADVWDTLGEPPFDMEECAQATWIFEPEDLSPAYCPLCLGPAPSAEHFDFCPVQIAWRQGGPTGPGGGRPVKLVGFFGDLPHGIPGGPTLRSAAASSPAADEDRLVDYLADGHLFLSSDDVAYDVIADPGEEGEPIARLVILTDGEWAWPSDLPYYVARYHVRLPQEFVEHVAKRGFLVPDDVRVEELDPSPVVGPR